MARAGAQLWKTPGAGRLGGALFACLLVIALLLAGASWSALHSARERAEAEHWRTHTLEVLRLTGELKINTLNALRGERGYLITGDPEFLEPLETGGPAARTAVGNLARITRNNPDQRAHVAEIERDLDSFLTNLGEIVDLTRSGRGNEAIVRLRGGEDRVAVEAILEGLAEVERHERLLLAQRTTRAFDATRLNELYQYGLTLVGLLLLAVGTIATFALRRALRAEAAVRRELHRLAATDALTGLANRRELFAALAREMAGSRRSGEPLSLAILDIDHFKRVNDSYGHPVGDDVIRMVAGAALDVMRGQDVIGRLGGEEFAIILPDCPPGSAFAACERLREDIAARLVEAAPGLTFSITLSAGVAGLRANDTAETLMRRADEALYLAKAAGRDRVKIAA